MQVVEEDDDTDDGENVSYEADEDYLGDLYESPQKQSISKIPNIIENE